MTTNSNFSNIKLSCQHFNNSVLLIDVFIHNVNPITGQGITNPMTLSTFMLTL